MYQMPLDNLGVGCPGPSRALIDSFDDYLQRNETNLIKIEYQVPSRTPLQSPSDLTPQPYSVSTLRSISDITTNPGTLLSIPPTLSSITNTYDCSSHIILAFNRMVEVINVNLGTCNICKRQN